MAGNGKPTNAVWSGGGPPGCTGRPTTCCTEPQTRVEQLEREQDQLHTDVDMLKRQLDEMAVDHGLSGAATTCSLTSIHRTGAA